MTTLAAANIVLPPKQGVYHAIPLGVIDGDTFRVGYMVEDTVRIFGIDAPAIIGKTREAGILSRNTLMLLVNNQRLTLDILTREKYGRALAKVYDAGGMSIAESMVLAGQAVPWDGHGPRPSEEIK